jgi:flagellar biogenesis protein FliO
MRSLFLTISMFSLLAAAAVAGDAVASTNAAVSIGSAGQSAAVSVFRMFGALCIVLALFFGGTWLFRNWARFNPVRASQRKLQVFETKTLGTRQGLYVIGYEQQRFLIGTTPQGMVLLSQLPDGEVLTTDTSRIVPLPFTEALKQALGRK